MPVPDQSMHGTLADWATMVDEILSPSERMAEPGGPMKMILCFDAASDSGSRGFSDACPLQVQHQRMSLVSASGVVLTIQPIQHELQPSLRHRQ